MKVSLRGHTGIEGGAAIALCLTRHSGRRKKTRQTEEEVGRQHQGMDRPGVRKAPQGNGEQGKMEKKNWLQNHLWCPNDPRGYGTDDDDDDCEWSFIK